MTWDETTFALGTSLMVLRPNEGLFKYLLSQVPTAQSFDGCVCVCVCACVCVRACVRGRGGEGEIARE